MAALLDKISEAFIRSLLWFTALFGICVAIFDAFKQIVVKLTTMMLEDLATLAPQDWQFDISDHEQTLATINYFFPLTEMWAMMIIAIGFYVTVLTVRWLKSFIPTIAN